jgi:L-ascorbate metabolism protein UlaG (beta-lactamase superfamily)
MTTPAMAADRQNRRTFLTTSVGAALGAFVLPTLLPAAENSPPEQCRRTPLPTFQNSPPATWRNDRLTVGWIGQSTMLINCYGRWILTDPLFSDAIGINLLGLPLGLRRYTPPALALDTLLDQIPPPDLILLSHAHIDHTDIPTLERLTQRHKHHLTLITAKNTADVVEHLAWGDVCELDWSGERCINGLNVRALEAVHNGNRLPFERDRRDGYCKTGRSYNAYRMALAGAESGSTVVFGGDTAYTPFFRDLAHEGGVDVACMPVGAYKDYEHLHCTPEQALQMADEMEARWFVPMHCRTFVQSEEPLVEPLERLRAAHGHYRTAIAMMNIGRVVSYTPTASINAPMARH